MLDPISVRNSRFSSATRAEQRVMIAQDVLDQLSSEQLRPATMTYVNVDAYACHVCAIGAMAVSLLNGKAIGLGASSLYYRLSEYFEYSDLILIEAAYERWMRRGWDFCCCTSDETARMRNIMENIVRNAGEFRPAEIPGAVEAGY